MLLKMHCVAVVAGVLAVFLSTASAVNFPPIWPYPSKFTNGSASVLVDSVNFKFSSNLAQSDCADIYQAFSRFVPVFFPHSVPRQSAVSDFAVTGVSVTILNCSVPLQLVIDESYSLEVGTGGCESALRFHWHFVLDM